MKQPSPPPERTSPPPSAPTSTEIVTRPEPGLARGKWEAPAWAFWVVLAAVLLGAATYLLARLGVLRIGRPAKEDPSSRRAGGATPRRSE